MDFNKVIILTDLDGTLLTDDKRILPQDMEAIRRFREGGGLFSIATGRGYSMARPVVEKLELDIPAVIFNGAAVYDFVEDSFLWRSSMGEHALKYVKRLADEFPHVGIEVLHEQNIYVPYMNKFERNHLALENVTPVECLIWELPRAGWLKVLLADDPENIDKIEKYVAKSDMQDAQWVRSAPFYFECLPLGVDKSTGFRELIRLLDCGDRFSVAAGDYMNDISMIQSADMGVAVDSAQTKVKMAADLIVCNNNSGAMADIINHIERL